MFPVIFFFVRLFVMLNVLFLNLSYPPGLYLLFEKNLSLVQLIFFFKSLKDVFIIFSLTFFLPILCSHHSIIERCV